MTWKKLNNAHLGFRTTFGGADIDKISSLFDGTADIDNVDINSATTIRSTKLKFRNPANTFSYTISPAAITADRIVTLPVSTGTDNLLVADASGALIDKTLTSSCEFEASDPTIPVPAPMSKFAVDPTRMKWGTVFPTGGSDSTGGAGLAALEGLLSNHTLRVPAGGNSFLQWNSFNYSGQHVVIETPTTQGEYCGIISPTTGIGPFRMSHDGLIRMRWAIGKTGDGVFYCGLSSSSSAPFDMHFPLGFNDSGIIVGVEVYGGLSHRGIYAHYHNGDGQPVAKGWFAGESEIGLGNLKFNDLQIKWFNDGGGLHADCTVQSSVPGSSSYIIPLSQNRLPAANTNLFFHCQLINQETDDKSLGIGGLWIECR